MAERGVIAKGPRGWQARSTIWRPSFSMAMLGSLRILTH